MSRIDVEVIEVKYYDPIYRATWRDGPFTGFTLECPDMPTLEVRMSEIENTGVNFDTFLAAMKRPLMVRRLAAGRLRADPNFPGAQTTFESASAEIDRAARAYARHLGMVAG